MVSQFVVSKNVGSNEPNSMPEGLVINKAPHLLTDLGMSLDSKSADKELKAVTPDLASLPLPKSW